MHTLPYKGITTLSHAYIIMMTFKVMLTLLVHNGIRTFNKLKPELYTQVYNYIARAT